MMGWWDGPGGGGWAWMLMHGIGSLLFLALLIGGVILVVRSGNRKPGRSLGRMAGFCLCAAGLLFGFDSVGIAQMMREGPGWSSSQFEGSGAGDPKRGQHVAEAKCAACHGADGNSPDSKYPKLAGQNPAYLYWQLWAFKRETGRSDVMSGIVATLSDADMADAASFYSRQPPKPDTVNDPRLAEIGESLFLSGMPSCAMCHGSAGQRGMHGMMGRMPMGGMMGMMADVPNLSGQHAAYIINQLNRFADGERQGTVMNRIAATLSETDKKAVAEYLSGAP